MENPTSGEAEQLSNARALAKRLWENELQNEDLGDVLLALQMLLPVVAVQAKVGFDILMTSIAANVPVFFKRWASLEAPAEVKNEHGN